MSADEEEIVIDNEKKSDKISKKVNKKHSNAKTKSEKKVSDLADTIFLRNLSFDTEEDTLKNFIEENFGPTQYCLICRDKQTDESKGTAFIRFKDPADSVKCLKEFKDRELQTKFHLDGRNLMVFPALTRDKVQDVKERGQKQKDKRHLNLAWEGFFGPNSEEAKLMSKTDLEKRVTLNRRKKELLKNLHNFVSDVRLCVHNLPVRVDDKDLRQIFVKAVKSEHPAAKITECRVMKNKKGSSGKLGASKGFGFVAFGKHEHALAALRKINNNPEIFTADKRPIVEFSIENMVALNKKKTRLVNSQRKLKSMQKKKLEEE